MAVSPTTATIYALASGGLPAGVAMMRLSGPKAGALLDLLTGRERPAPRQAVLRRLSDPDTDEILDQALCLWFPGPGSFTGEDVVELHLHGGRAVVAGVVAVLERQAGLRPAEAGEFTRRAFDAGKLDLTAVEGLADLVAAETAAQRRQALRQMGGALASLYEEWRHRLVTLLAFLEASIDFSDEELPEDLWMQALADVPSLLQDIHRHLDDAGKGERLRDGLSVVILGPPNAGKSSLLNALAGWDAAIVTETAGTTRDVIEVRLDLGGYPVTLADTAGLHPSDDPIEQEGMRRAEARGDGADLRLFVFDAEAEPLFEPALLAHGHPGDVFLVNKQDRRPEMQAWTLDHWQGVGWPADRSDSPLPISVIQGKGLAALRQRLTDGAKNQLERETALPVLTRARHRLALIDCVEALQRGLSVQAPELVAEEIRAAARALGRITGRIDVEDLLDRIFADFCIGK